MRIIFMSVYSLVTWILSLTIDGKDTTFIMNSSVLYQYLCTSFMSECDLWRRISSGLEVQKQQMCQCKCLLAHKHTGCKREACFKMFLLHFRAFASVVLSKTSALDEMHVFYTSEFVKGPFYIYFFFLVMNNWWHFRHVKMHFNNISYSPIIII